MAKKKKREGESGGSESSDSQSRDNTMVQTSDNMWLNPQTEGEERVKKMGEQFQKDKEIAKNWRDQNMPSVPTEVNPEVREQFEAKYGKGAKLGIHGKERDYGFESDEQFKSLPPEEQARIKEDQRKGIIQDWRNEQTGINKIPVIGTGIQNVGLITTERGKRVLNAMTTGEAALQAGKLPLETGIAAALIYGGAAALGALGTTGASGALGTVGQTAATKSVGSAALGTLGKAAGTKILGVSAGKLALGAGGLIAAGDAITNWMGMDNILSQDSILVRDMKEQFPYATTDERARMLDTAKRTQSDIKIVKDKITASTYLNPLNWPFAKMWKTGIETAERNINNNIVYMENYNPYIDKRSLELQRKW